jgi:hypothetical protein
VSKQELRTLAAETRAIVERIDGLRSQLCAASEQALGRWDEVTDTQLEPGNGDDFELFEKAKDRCREASSRLGVAVSLLAQVQGWRDFAESGAVPAP